MFDLNGLILSIFLPKKSNIVENLGGFAMTMLEQM